MVFGVKSWVVDGLPPCFISFTLPLSRMIWKLNLPWLVLGMRRRFLSRQVDTCIIKAFIPARTQLVSVDFQGNIFRQEIYCDGYMYRLWNKGQPMICNLSAKQRQKSANCPNKVSVAITDSQVILPALAHNTWRQLQCRYVYVYSGPM